ncbi:MAG TPA: DUF932 domain-containing protein [Pseudonocardiaceae bacterium]
MTNYASHDPLHSHGTDRHGTRTATVTAIGRADFASGRRFPAFVGLAKATGGYYAENDHGMTLDQALRAARLDYTVDFVPLTVPVVGPNGVDMVEFRQRGTVATWPDGTRRGLGTVGARYQIVQPAQVGELGQAVLSESGANIVAAGAFGDPVGSRSYLAFKLPEGLTVGGQDPHDLYLTLLNSHDGSSGLTGLLAPIRLACTNQTAVTFGRGVANRFTIRHTGDTTGKIGAIRRALRLGFTWSAAWTAAAEQLLSRPLAGADLDAFLRAVLPTPASATTPAAERGWADRRWAIRQVITSSATNEFGRGTAYAAYNGVVEYADFLSSTQATDPTASAIARYTRTLQGGPTENLKLHAARLLGVGH